MFQLQQAARLGSYQQAVDAALGEMQSQRIIPRIWARDHTVWQPDPTEVANRLGWLDIATRMRAEQDRLAVFVDAVRADGYTDVLLFGMGGSSLAPEMLGALFGGGSGALKLHVLDSTHPDAVLAAAEQLDLARTLFIVSTKSGTTVETLSLFKFFYNRVVELVGGQAAGAHFVAITDPGSTLAELAEKLAFRRVWLNDPDIGGRYSALSYVGLVPAALVGADVSMLLASAEQTAAQCGPQVEARQNPAAWFGAVLGELARAGRDKLTLIAPLEMTLFCEWAEQLVAESTGKLGRGILPVVGEPVGTPDQYGSDRLFVQLRPAGDARHDAALEALADAGHPVVRIDLAGPYDVGGQFFLWELATAVAGYRLGIQPFDQPDVEAAKKLARKLVAAYMEQGTLPEQSPALRDGGISVYGDVSAANAAGALREFLTQSKPGNYVTVQAYLQPTAEATAALRRLQAALFHHTRLATTLGYGPRFLHSTGQLHKGDAGSGLFIQLTDDPAHAAPIPDEAGSAESAIAFGVLIAAQAMGDRQALLDKGRRVIRFHLGGNALDGIAHLQGALG